MTFNMKKYAASKKSPDGDMPIESKLRVKPAADEPQQVSEAQLDDRREGTEDWLTEKKLENRRTGAAETLRSERLDASDSGLVMHRNKSAYEGDINKLEEQRLANSPVEKEKYEPAAVFDKRTMKEIKGDDGLRTASVVKQAVGATEFDIDYPVPSSKTKKDDEESEWATISPGMEEAFGIEPHVSREEEEVPDFDIEAEDEDDVDPATQKMIDEMTQETDKELEEGGEDIVDSDLFQQTEIRPVRSGGRRLTQYEFVFDPMMFAGKDDAETKAAAWIMSSHPDIPKEFDVLDNLVMDYVEGRVTLTVPA